jgi:thymidine kinase
MLDVENHIDVIIRDQENKYRWPNFVIGIDEAQFFTHMTSVVEDLLRLQDIVFIIAGLNRDYRGGPFYGMRDIMPLADTITVLDAVCAKCGQDGATMTYRVSEGEDQIEIDTGHNYEARCRECFYQ